jgi:hypothetical protein
MQHTRRNQQPHSFLVIESTFFGRWPYKRCYRRLPST